MLCFAYKKCYFLRANIIQMDSLFSVLFAVACVVLIVALFVNREHFIDLQDSTYSYNTVIITDEETGDFGPKKTVFGDASSMTDPKLRVLNLDAPSRCGYTKFETDNTQGSGAPKLNADDMYFARWIQGRPSGDEPNPYICGMKPKFSCVPYITEVPHLVTQPPNTQVNLG